MIWAVVVCKFRALSRDRIASLLVFVLPIVFYSIFAGIFGNLGESVATRVTVLLVDEGDTVASNRLIAALEHSGSGMVLSREHSNPPQPWTAQTARAAVERGEAPAAIVLPKELSVGLFGSSSAPSITLFVDPANPVAATMIPGLLQQAAMGSMQGELVRSGVAEFEKIGGPLTLQQKTAMRMVDLAFAQEPAADGASFSSGMLLPVAIENVRTEKSGETRPMVAYYVAGIGVMFLLFSTTGAAGSLLDDEEAGILDRVLSSPLGMSRLLFAEWLWVMLMGLTSMAVLFVFATLVFGLGPWTLARVIATAIMTVFTAGAASALGMLLASLCRSRGQLAGISTVVILVMSALGGSMMPRFLMPDVIKTVGLGTFNAWAVEGYLEVFWYSPTDISLGALLGNMAAPLGVLLGMLIVFMVLARIVVRRWETT
jgi:ABC-2 type transport system permease protein